MSNTAEVQEIRRLHFRAFSPIAIALLMKFCNPYLALIISCFLVDGEWYIHPPPPPMFRVLSLPFSPTVHVRSPPPPEPEPWVIHCSGGGWGRDW
jgi:hypothetical protein